MKINISKLSEGIHDFNLQADPSQLELDDKFTSPVSVNVKLDKSSSQIYLKAEIVLDVNFTCDRCLIDFKSKFHTSFSIVFMYETRGLKGEQLNDVQILSPDTNHIDIAEDVRQYILLAIPIKILCSENCKGLCSSCGIDLNENKCKCDNNTYDPRWETLFKTLKNKKNN
ncbi:MAG: DUF177 domain-containing protein [Bacteroidota bacterium]|nr:DUF177 domain-containing protein [Bacteroidota bacterium]